MYIYDNKWFNIVMMHGNLKYGNNCDYVAEMVA